MAYIIVTTDDFRPSLIQMWRSYWDVLKRKHPKLEVTVFLPVRWEGMEKEDVSKSKELLNWYEKRKDWVSVCVHGLFHELPPKCLGTYGQQEAIIGLSLKKLKKYLPKDILGFKPPFYRMNDATIQVLHNLNFDYYSQWWTTCLLKVNKRPMPPFMELGTHTNDPALKNPDNIPLIYEKLDKHLTELEMQGHEYSNLNEMVRKVI